MHQTIAHRVFSLLMTFAMILTCNCATFQLIAAYAADDAPQAAGPVAPGDVDAPQGASSGNHGGDVGGDLDIGDGAGPLGGGGGKRRQGRKPFRVHRRLERGGRGCRRRCVHAVQEGWKGRRRRRVVADREL